MLNRIVLTTLLFSLSLTLLMTTTVSAADDTLQGRLDRSIENVAKSATKVSAVVIDIETGKVVYDHRGDRALIPASNMKLLSTAAALVELGEDFSFKTKVLSKGQLKNGVLSGDLLLKGYGDPNISGRFHNGDATAVYRSIADALKARGISRVTGDLLYDESYFSGPRIHPDWPANQYLKWYEAEVSALNLNDNCLTITVAPTDGKHARVTAMPNLSSLTLTSEVAQTDAKSDPKVGWTRPQTSNEFRVWGTISRNRPAYTGDCTVYDPANFAATTFREVLETAGIKVDGKLQSATVSEGQLKAWSSQAEFSSGLPISVYVCNLHSQNLYAEVIARTFAKESGFEGSFEGVGQAMAAFMKKHKLPAKDLVVSDGSGLASTNRVSPLTFASLCTFMANHPQGSTFKASLPVAGQSGTLEKRLRGASTKGRVFGKTGYINGVYSLSGYVDHKNGKRYAFSIILNDARGRAPVDAFVTALAS